MPILATKLHIPQLRPDVVFRPHLIERLNAGLHRKLTLISAAAGSGKTTLLSQWVAGCERPVAWLSLDEADSDPARFLAYLVAALRTIAPQTGAGVIGLLQSSQPPPVELMLTALLNEIATIPHHFVLVLDDYHTIEARPLDQALTFLIEHQPPQLHLVVATREDPPLPLARLRARGQLTELRIADLRFSLAETALFFTQAMGLNLPAEAIAALEARTEGWIAGLQLAALSMQGVQDHTSFIRSFTGSHRFVLDYLVEEVLQYQSEAMQTFLLHTAMLNRLCGPLCDAVLGAPSASGQATLEYLEHANLFIVPLDNERRWYRYHHLFAELLRQRLQQRAAAAAGSVDIATLHRRASLWYEANGLELEAFHHAVAANDVDLAERLIIGKGMPLQFRGALAPVLNWLASLPATVLDSRPALWVMYASALSMTGQLAGVEPKLQAAERALQSAEPDEHTRNLIGHIAAIRALLAAVRYQAEAIIYQSQRALEYLHPANLAVRTATTWKLGIAYQLQGERAAAAQAFAEAAAISQSSGNLIITISATTGLGNIQELENQLHQAAETYRRVLQLAGDPPMPAACEAQLGLGRICYEWNDLDTAGRHVQQAIRLARQLDNPGRSTACELLLARLALGRGDPSGAAVLLAKADQSVQLYKLNHLMADLITAQVDTLLYQGNREAAARLADTYDLPLSRARVALAQDEPAAALALLVPFHRQMQARGWQNEQLKALLLLALAHDANGEQARALQILGEALRLAEPGGFVRLFVGEGAAMVQLLNRIGDAEGREYRAGLLAAFGMQQTLQPLVEPLSRREHEVLRLIAQGLSNREIGEQLVLAVSSVKGHIQNIFGKLQVQRRTEAVARARELGLL